MLKFLQFLVLGYLIYIFLRNILKPFLIKQVKKQAYKHMTGNGQGNPFSGYQQQNNEGYDYHSSTYTNGNGKSYGATRVDHIPEEETYRNSATGKSDEGEYIDYKEVK